MIQPPMYTDGHGFLNRKERTDRKRYSVSFVFFPASGNIEHRTPKEIQKCLFTRRGDRFNASTLQRFNDLTI